MNRKIFIAGCGYVGGYVADMARDKGWEVSALARSETRREALRSRTIQVASGDLDHPQTLASLEVAGCLVYYFAPPPPQGEQDQRLANFLQVLSHREPPDKLVLISTTGVYGDCGGEWVDESRPPNPGTDRARRRLDAEGRLTAWAEARSVPWVILRVPGIYGPGRLPENRLNQGLPVLAEELSPYSNRIHVIDLARACIAAGEHGEGIYNISDGRPGTMSEYFNRVADVLGLPRPPVLDREQAARRLSREMQAYLAESRRLDNRRMREDLGVEPLYPDLDSGLRQCLELP